MPTEQGRAARERRRVHGSDRVDALFVEEVAAQEAIGLLAFHGFSRDGIRVRPADGTHLRRFRPLRRRHPPGRRRGRAMAGCCVGLLAVAVGLWMTGRWSTAFPELLLLAAGCLVGALVGALSDPPARVVEDESSTDVLTPTHGCIVAVLTLRADEARTVLKRPGGILVLPEGGTWDADGHGWDGYGPDPAG